MGMGEIVANLLRTEGLALYHLGLSKDGHPKHPLYLPYEAELQLW